MTNEGLKIWLSFVKFLLGTVALGIASFLINAQIQNKEIEINRELQHKELELKETSQDSQNLSNYIELALEKDLPKRRDFAMYFALVSRTQEARERWKEYTNFIDLEIKTSRNKQEETISELAAKQTGIESLQESLFMESQTTGDAKRKEELEQQLRQSQLELVIKQNELNRLNRQLASQPEQTALSIISSIQPQQIVRGANLHGKTIHNVNRKGEDLENIDLSDATLIKVNMAEAFLNAANFEGARLVDVNFIGSDLNNANFRNVLFKKYVNFKNANLRSAIFTGSLIELENISVRFLNADLRGAVGLTCESLRQASGWQSAVRDKALACGEEIPNPRIKLPPQLPVYR